MTNDKLRFFYFDLGNVLLRFDHERAVRQMAEVADVTEDRIREVVFDSDLLWRFESGELDSRGFYDAFSLQTGTRPDFADLHRALADIFELNVPIVPVVAGLKTAGYRMGILSNTNEVHWNFVSDGRYRIVPTHFEKSALSFEIKAMKPHRSIYEAAAKLAGVVPEQIFFVDDRAENVAGAREYGIDAVPFTTASQLARDLRDRGIEFNY